ncbi:MAG: hypothetical protein ABFS34_16785, partial [Gemmatimonadota bacterium]
MARKHPESGRGALACRVQSGARACGDETFLESFFSSRGRSVAHIGGQRGSGSEKKAVLEKGMNAREFVGRLDRGEVIGSLDVWVKRERDATAVIVAHLVVLERERIHIDMGYASLFSYCTERLGYSRDAAYKRIRAARAAEDHPEVIDHLESGELSLSGVLALAKHLTGGEVGKELLEASRKKSTREIEAMVATEVRTLPRSGSGPRKSGTVRWAARFPDANSPRGELRMKAVGDELVRIEMVVATSVAEKLERARDIDRHRNPSGDIEPILDEALDLFVAGVEKRKHAVVDAPRARNEEIETETVPAAVRRAVHDRDGGRCTFEGTERVCGEQAFVEFDHVQSRARGGEHSEENGAELCGVHNRRKAELEMGTDAIDRGRARTQTERDLLSAMVNLGYRRPEARARTREALDKLGPDSSLESLC